MDTAIKMTRQEDGKVHHARSTRGGSYPQYPAAAAREIGFAVGEHTTRTKSADDGAARSRFRKMLREGALDDKEVEVEVSAPAVGLEIFAPPAWRR